MKYFESFPNIWYAQTDTSDPVLLKHIISRFKLVDIVKENTGHYIDYIIKDGESPDGIAQKFYDNPDFHWVILLYNNIIDFYELWPLSSQLLEKACIMKYGSIPQLYQVHHYENEDGITVDPTQPGTKIAVTNWDYESKLNDDKRFIKLPAKSQLAYIEDQINAIMATA